MTRLAVAVVLLAALTGCYDWSSRSFFGRGDSEGYWLPLTVSLRLGPSVTEAGLDYTDPCRQRRTFPITDRVHDALKRDIGMVFEHVHTDAQPLSSGMAATSDGVVEVVLGLKELTLLIPRQDTKSYAATITLGATVTYFDAAGNLLYTKSLRTETRGNVNTERQSCEVHGLAGLANEAVATLTQGLKKHLGTSIKIRQAAEAQKGGARPLSPGSSAEAKTGGGVPLSFRAMLKDETKDQVIESGEQVSVEVEVTNAGPDFAREVVVTLSGSPALVQLFTGPIPVGDLSPGETRRVEVSGRLQSVAAAQQAELVISVATSSAGTGLPNPKRFVAALRPAKSEDSVERSIDVDQVPERVRGYERRKAVGIAIGVGAFRDPDVPGVKFASHDAEVMANYFSTVGGIPAKQIKVVTDEHALKEDVAEVLENWLPQRVESGGSVFVFFSGRAMVDPATGAVSLFPYEGTPTSPIRLYSLRRLHAALTRLPLQYAVLLLDITLTAGPDPVLLTGKGPVWDAAVPAPGDGTLVQILSISGVQKAHHYEERRHGLFTYYLLKGLGGAADGDGNGVVAMGELFEYVRAQVPKAARAEGGNEQVPMSVPALGPNAKTWNFPLARVK